MERSVVENHHLAGLQRLDQMLREPRFDQSRVAVALEGQRRDHPRLPTRALAPSRSHRDSFGAMSQSLPVAPCSFAAPAISVAHRVIHSGFIDINALLLGNAFQDFEKRTPLVFTSFKFASFKIKTALFLRVHPMRFKVLPIVTGLNREPVSSCQASAICTKVKPL